jgi:hypothetical protein
VAIAHEGSWSDKAAGALDLITRAYGRLWSQRVDRERAQRAAEEVRCVCVCVCVCSFYWLYFTGTKVRNTDGRAAEEASFAFRDRKVELKSEAELEVLSLLALQVLKYKY